MGDPSIEHQLISGFYAIEGNSWRWTARQFVITFPGCPQSDGHKTHLLRLNVFIPESQLKQLGPITLRADVNGSILEGETFREPGMHSFLRAVPEPALATNILPVVFFLDKSTSDGRDLGLVVNDAQLTVN